MIQMSRMGTVQIAGKWFTKDHGMDQFQIDGHKASLHPQRIAQWLDAGDDWDKVKKVYPLYVEIASAGGCNQRCRFCAVDYIGYKSVMIEPHALRHCLSDMAAHGVKSVMYAGEGEPLLNKQLPDLIAWTKRYGIDVAITTNATALTEKFAECLGFVSWLKASVNGGTDAVYSAVHKAPENTLQRVLRNLAHAVQLRNEYRWKTTIGAQMVLLPENAGTAAPLAGAIRDLGADYFVVKPFSAQPLSTETSERYGEVNYGRDFPGLADELAAYNTDKFSVVYREKTMANLASGQHRYKQCLSTPMLWCAIMATGRVFACGAHLEDEAFYLGDINCQSFSEIWEGDRRRKCWEMMRSYDIGRCRLNCRMEGPNQYLDRIKNPQAHDAFI